MNKGSHKSLCNLTLALLLGVMTACGDNDTPKEPKSNPQTSPPTPTENHDTGVRLPPPVIGERFKVTDLKITPSPQFYFTDSIQFQGLTKKQLQNQNITLNIDSHCLFGPTGQVVTKTYTRKLSPQIPLIQLLPEKILTHRWNQPPTCGFSFKATNENGSAHHFKIPQLIIKDYDKSHTLKIHHQKAPKSENLLPYPFNVSADHLHEYTLRLPFKTKITKGTQVSLKEEFCNQPGISLNTTCEDENLNSPINNNTPPGATDKPGATNKEQDIFKITGQEKPELASLKLMCDDFSYTKEVLHQMEYPSIGFSNFKQAIEQDTTKVGQVKSLNPQTIKEQLLKKPFQTCRILGYDEAKRLVASSEIFRLVYSLKPVETTFYGMAHYLFNPDTLLDPKEPAKDKTLFFVSIPNQQNYPIHLFIPKPPSSFNTYNIYFVDYKNQKEDNEPMALLKNNMIIYNPSQAEYGVQHIDIKQGKVIQDTARGNIVTLKPGGALKLKVYLHKPPMMCSTEDDPANSEYTLNREFIWLSSLLEYPDINVWEVADPKADLDLLEQNKVRQVFHLPKTKRGGNGGEIGIGIGIGIGGTWISDSDYMVWHNTYDFRITTFFKDWNILLKESECYEDHLIFKSAVNEHIKKEGYWGTMTTDSNFATFYTHTKEPSQHWDILWINPGSNISTYLYTFTQVFGTATIIKKQNDKLK